MIALGRPVCGPMRPGRWTPLMGLCSNLEAADQYDRVPFVVALAQVVNGRPR